MAGLLAVAFSLSAGVSAVRSAEVSAVYERSLAPSINTHFSVRPVPYVGVGVQFAFAQRNGIALGVSSLEPTGQATQMDLATLGLRIEGRLEVAPHQRVVPYVVAGPLATFYREQVGMGHIAGGKPGAFVGGGVCLLLNPEASWSLQARPRLDGVYLVMEAGHRWARWASGEGLDLGGWQLHGGLEVSFR